MSTPLLELPEKSLFARLPRWLLPLLVLLYVVYFFGALRFAAPGFAERDGYYHVRFAQMLPHMGITSHFPWTACSTWTTQYCDKEFLYHVLMVPFCWDQAEPANGARYFQVFSVLLIFIALFWVLKKNAVPGVALFLALPLCLGGDFLARLEMIRSHVLSITLAILAMHLILRGYWKALFFFGFIYAWSYSFPLVLVMFAVPAVMGRWFGGDRLDWKSPLAAFAGVTLGLAIHPYSPHTFDNLRTIFQVIWFGSQSDGAIRLGDETYSYVAREMLVKFPLYHALWAGLLVLGWRLKKSMSPAFFGALFAAVFWHLMFMFYLRFCEYAVPLLVLALGFGARDVLQGTTLKELLFPARPLWRMACFAGAALLLAAMHVHSSFALYRDGALQADPPRYKQAAKWLEKHTQPGEVVVNLWWHDFPDLYYDGYRQNYIWGIDPSFTFRYDPQTAEWLEQMRKGTIPLDAKGLSEKFQARYAIFKNYSPDVNYPEMRNGSWQPVYFDKTAVIYDLQRVGNTGGVIVPKKAEREGNFMTSTDIVVPKEILKKARAAEKIEEEIPPSGDAIIIPKDIRDKAEKSGHFIDQTKK